MSLSHLILYLCCKFHGNIPNDCQDIANLLLGILIWATLYTWYSVHRRGVVASAIASSAGRQLQLTEELLKLSGSVICLLHASLISITVCVGL